MDNISPDDCIVDLSASISPVTVTARKDVPVRLDADRDRDGAVRVQVGDVIVTILVEFDDLKQYPLDRKALLRGDAETFGPTRAVRGAPSRDQLRGDSLSIELSTMGVHVGVVSQDTRRVAHGFLSFDDGERLVSALADLVV